MIRNYRALGVAVAAMLGLSAFLAQAASAAPLTTESITVGTVYTTGNQESVAKFGTSHGGSVECSSVHYLGEAAVLGGAASHWTVTPIYPTTCTAFGFANTHIITNDCKFTFTTPWGPVPGEVTWVPTLNGEHKEIQAQLHLVCGTGKSITVTPTAFGASVCTLHIEPQTPTTGHVLGRNIVDNNKLAITLEMNLKALHYIGTGGVCGPNGVTTTDGTLTGNSAVTCFSDPARTLQTNCKFS